jgi:hypothetical protein
MLGGDFMIKKCFFVVYILSCAVLANSSDIKDKDKQLDTMLDSYFDSVRSQNIDSIMANFLSDAVIQANDRNYTGHDEIKQFYENGILKCTKFFPMPQKRHYMTNNSIAVEIGLNCDGNILMVGDFFYFKNNKISRLHVYKGPHVN